MKEFLFTVFGVLVASCIFNSVAIWLGVLPNMAPYPVPSGITDKAATPAFGTNREDFCYPEIHYTKGNRPVMIITEISGKGDRSNAEFPLGANN